MNKNFVLGLLVAAVLALGIGMGAGTLLAKKGVKGSKADEQPAVEAVEEETEEPAMEETAGDVDAAQNAEEATAEEPADAASNTGEATEVSEREWKDAYLAYMKQREEDDVTGMDFDYRDANLIYVNDDEIPELVVIGTCEAEGNQILTYSPKNGVDELQTNRLYFYYVEKGNILINSDGNSGYYHDLCYKIEDGKWACVGDGSNTAMPDESGEWAVQDYYWGEEECTEEEYQAHLDSLIQHRDTLTVGISIAWPQMKALLQDEGVDLDKYRYVEESKDIHRYELIKTTDTAWSVAYDAVDAGGYLCHINSKAEYDYLVDLIKKEGMEKCVFYIGGENPYQDPGHYRWKVYSSKYDYQYGSQIINEDSELKDLWMAGEPSFKGTDMKGEEVTEDQMAFMYYGKEDRFVFNDVPSDLTPYYGDRVAYIVEYDN